MKLDKIVTEYGLPTAIEVARKIMNQLIIEKLKTDPMKLDKIVTEYGLPTAIEVARKIVNELGGHPSEEQAKKLFSDNRDNTRRWLATHKIPSPRGSSSRKKADSNQVGKSSGG